MKKAAFISFLLLTPIIGFTQDAKGPSNNGLNQVSWKINPYDRKVFIENRGQFDAEVRSGEKVLFYAMMGRVKVYFTAHGIIYRYDKHPEIATKESEDNDDDPEKNGNLPVETHYLKTEWLGSNPNVTVDAQQEQNDYYTYATADNTALRTNAFKKITYHNLYPGIDLEYTFPINNEGIKYALVVHPGADIGKLKIQYDSLQSILLDDKGNLNLAILYPKVTDILDHAPKTFYEDTKKSINSSFILKSNQVSFAVSGYDASKEIIIDPWSINPGFTTTDNAYDISKDLAGNIYSYGGGGGGSPWSVKKFTPAGVAVWTFTTTYASWFGDLAVDPAGNSYITEGCCGGGIQKINTGGTSVWSVNNGVYEYWLLSFDCSYTNLYLGCAYSSGAIPAESVSHLNTGTGAITGAVTLNTGGSEPRSIAWAPNGNLYFLSCTGGNDVLGVTPAFANIFSVPSGYALAYNGPTYADGANPTSGQNGIAAGKTFIASTNGATLSKRNLNTGALLASIAVPGGIVEGNSGVLVDGCGNIFVGSQTAVYEFDSTLAPITNIATAGAVYDLYPAGNGQILACGKNFIASMNFPTSANYSITKIKTGASCSACNGTAKATLILCGITDTTNVTYLWSNGQTTQTATSLCTGTYTVTISVGCSPNSYSDTVNIFSGPGGLTLTKSSTASTCAGNNGTASVTVAGGTAPYTYTWSNGQTSSTAAGLSSGTYCVTVKDHNGCNDSVCVTVGNTGGLTLSTGPIVNVSCNGGNNGSSGTTVAGGTVPYTYNWNNGETSATATGLSAGTYTITVTDKNGCTATATAIITQPTLLVATIGANTNVLCNGGNNGSTSVTGSGGTPAYTYNWSNGETTSNATGLTAGSYTITLKDNNGCSVTAVTTITQPTPLVATLGPNTNVSCNGGNNGSASVTGSGGTAPYTYNWSNGETTSNATGLTAGSYTITLKDNNGCSATASTTITAPPILTTTITSTPATCSTNNGTTTAGPSGGTAPYNYSWTSGSTSITATGLSAGSYTVTVTDANGCTVTASVTVTNTGGLTVSTGPLTNVLCNGGNNGGSGITVVGGTTPYTYNWSNGETTSNATGLTAGTYTITVTDANGCMSTATATITQPTLLVATIGPNTNVSCNGGTNGSTNVTAAGGTTPYTYNWSNGETTSNATGLTAGSYTITLQDNNGCISTASVVITEPPALTGTTSSTAASCGINNGTATATPAGGTGTYTYLWTPTAQTNATATGLTAGSYTVNITDANGCTLTASVNVASAGTLSASITAKTNISCNGGNNGSITVTGAGGTLPYTYLWTPTAQTNATATNLTAGTYTVVVTDANGCIVTASASITQPTQVRDSIINSTNILCFGQSNGTAGVGVKGGTPGYIYAWTPSGGTSASASGLSSGTFTITITDANGCTTSASITITEPPALTLTAAAFPTSCNGASNGQATVIPANGVPPYSYLWSNGNTTANANFLTAGTYTITVTDANGCTHDTTVSVKQPPPIIMAFAADTLSGCYPLCFNFIDASSDPNGTIKKWNWSFGDGGTDTLQNPRHCYTLPGVYSVSLTLVDSKGCTNTLTETNLISVYDHPHPDFTFTPQPATILQPTITFTDKSTDLYGIASWLWNFGDPYSDSTSTLQNPLHKYSDTGIFCAQLIVTNIHGCVDSITHCLVISDLYTLYIPDAFSPNGDGINDIFTPKGEGIKSYEMYVFDRWGMLLYHTTDIYKGWNGTVNGGSKAICQEDTYVYVIKVKDNIDKDHTYIGKLTLIR